VAGRSGYRVFSLDGRAGSFEGHWLVELAQWVADEALHTAAG
jgi:hypothetical protein